MDFFRIRGNLMKGEFHYYLLLKLNRLFIRSFKLIGVKCNINTQTMR